MSRSTVDSFVHLHTSRPREQSRWALGALALGMLLPSLGTSIANIGLPAIAEGFDAPFGEVQWVVLAYLIAVTGLAVVGGRLGDLAGRRRLLLAGIVTFAAGSIACSVAPSLPLLIAARGIQGTGAALMMALTLALVADTMPKNRVGTAMGLLGTMSAIGTAAGPSLGGILIDAFGWRSVFVVQAPIAVFAAVLAWRFLPVDALARGAHDQAAPPLLPLSMLREPGVGAALANSFLVSTVLMATLIVGPFYLTRGLGLDATIAGLSIAAGPIVAALTAAPAGRLVDSYGSQKVAIAGLVAIASGCLAISALSGVAGVTAYVAAIAIVTSGYALFQTANNTAVMTGVGTDRRGMASGLLGFSRNIGLIAGASGMGAVFAFATGTGNFASASAAALVTGTRVTFGVAALMMVLSIAIAFTVSRVRGTWN